MIIKRFIEVLEGETLPPTILSVDRNGKNILHLACSSSLVFLEVIKLIAKFPDALFSLLHDRETSEQRTPLHFALKSIDSASVGVLRRYLSTSKFEELMKIEGGKGLTPVQLCVKSQSPENVLGCLELLGSQAVALIGCSASDGTVSSLQVFTHS